jgi:hypothetical protein
MGEHRRRIDEVLDAAFLTELSEWPLDELRSRHAECLEIETEVSYVRRMTQARIDILEAELDRRASGGSVGDLIAALPEILADEGPRAPVEKSRLTRHLAPSMDIKWRRGREHLITDDTLAKLPNLDDDECGPRSSSSASLEQELSAQRRNVLQVIDRMEGDLAARHKVGQA